MLRAYVCHVCLGVGEIFDVNTEKDSTISPCPSCAGSGLPPRIEIPVNGPPAAKEMIVEATLMPITQTLDGDPWKTEEPK